MRQQIAYFFFPRLYSEDSIGVFMTKKKRSRKNKSYNTALRKSLEKEYFCRLNTG